MNAAYADIDECSEGLDECASNATCANTESSYTCSCDTGYHGDGFTCEGMLSYLRCLFAIGTDPKRKIVAAPPLPTPTS